MTPALCTHQRPSVTLPGVTRAILAQDEIHPAVRERVARLGADIVGEVQAAVRAHRVVVVGMGINPFPRKARRLLDAASVPYHYLGYGSYFTGWRRRLPLKMWTGWPTLPMVFVDGIFIGGADDLAKLDLEALRGPRVDGRS